LGAILYEMATGKRAFEKPNAPDTLSAILHEEPLPMAESAPRAPAPLAWIVERCLSKDAADRYASTKDLARDLANLRERVSQSSGSMASLTPLPMRRRSWRLLFAAALLLAGAAIGVVASRRPPEEPPRYRQLTFRRGTIADARFAPDGQTIVYGARWEGGPLRLFSTRADSTESTLLPLPAGRPLSISSSGKIALALMPEPWSGGQYVGSQTLAEVALAGGSPREILRSPGPGFLFASWSPDGQGLAVATEQPGRLEFPVGRVLYQVPNGFILGVAFSPDGKSIAVVESRGSEEFAGQAFVLLDLVGKGKILSRGWSIVWGLAWHPKTGELWFSAQDASRGNLALHAVSPSGRHRLIARAPDNLDICDISRDGRVLLTRDEFSSSMMWLPPGSTKEVDLTWLNFSVCPILSEDGKEVLFGEFGYVNGAEKAVYLRKTDGSPAIRLGEGRPADLSSDGNWAISIPVRADRLLLLPTGAGQPSSLGGDGLMYSGAKWFPDAKRILFSASAAGHQSRLYVEASSGGTARPLTPEGFEIGPLSPDGKLVATRGPDKKVVLYPIAGGEPRPVQGVNSDDTIIRWDAKGEALFLAGNGTPVRIDRLVLSTGRREVWKELAEAADPTSITLTPDGKSYAYSFRHDQSNLYVVEGLR